MAAGPSLRIAPVRYQIGVGPGGVYYGLVVPSTVIPGDRLIMAINQPTSVYPLPSGWTSLYAGTDGQVWTKRATSTDPGVTYTAGIGAVGGGFLLDYKGCATTTPLISHTTGSGTSMTAPAITTTVNKSTVAEVWLLGQGNLTVTVPSTVEDNFRQSVPGFNDYHFGVSDQTQATAGLAAAETATASVTIGWTAYSLVIFPAAVPSAPILALPTNGTMAVLSGTPAFSWLPQPTNGDGAMNAYAFRRKIGAGAYSYWNATSSTWSGTIVWNTSSSSSVTFTAASWSDSSNYLWSVATQEATYSGQSPFAADFTVNGQVAPTVTVTAPTATIFVSNPTVTWTDTMAGGCVGTSYRVVVYNAAQYGAGGFVPGFGPNAWDSGRIAPFANTLTLPAYAIPTLTAYRAYVRLHETGNVASAWGYSAFSLMIELPAVPSLTATAGTDPVTNAPLVTLALQAHDNLLTAVDASVETTTGSWVGTNATLADVANSPPDGSYSLAMTAVGAGAMSATTAAYTI